MLERANMDAAMSASLRKRLRAHRRAAARDDGDGRFYNGQMAA
jgi:hypothetical protein